jgi:hypothetical protein
MQDLAMLTERAKEYVAGCTGEFTAWSLAKELGIHSIDDRDSIMSDLCALKLCEPTGRKNGSFIPVSDAAPVIDWLHAKEAYEPLLLPLGLHNAAGITRRSLVLVAGETNTGKSYLSMLIAHMNLKQNGGAYEKIHFWNSETTPGAIRANAKRVDSELENWRGLNVKERTEDFHHVIMPDDLNIIDYLQVEDEFYLVGKKIKLIFEALGKGICVIFIQKNKGAALGIGGNFTQHKPALALSLTEQHGIVACKITKLKFPIQFPNAEGMECDFKFNAQGGIDTVAGWRYLSKKNRDELWTQYERERALLRTSYSFGAF